MADNKYVLIVENSVNGLTPILENKSGLKDKNLRLSGIFTEFDMKNRNERIYTAPKFLPHLDELLERKNTLGLVYGEWDHPDVFDTSLSRVSHTIEKAFFNESKNRVDGEIRLLSTHWGKEARALVEDGCPLFVSSRAAGVTESDGTVTVKKLFTYDCVADPGFGTAKMSLNESLGFKEKNANFRIFDISDESKINELFNMNNNEFVTKQQMVEYSEYLTKEVENVKLKLTESAKNGNVAPEEIVKISEIYESLQLQQNNIAKYLDYLAETMQVVVNENKSLKEKTEKLAEHNDYLAKSLEESINYTEYLAETLDKNISYGEYIAETLDKSVDFAEYVAEHVNKNIEFSDYLAESLEKNINYSEYIAENLDKNIAYSEYIAESLDSNISYSEYIAENLDKNIAYSEYIAENLDSNIEYSEYIAEHVDNNIEYAEYIAENVDNGIAYSEYVAENVSNNQAYMKYIAESLDRTINVVKSNKIFENAQGAQLDMNDVDIEGYYDDEDDFAPVRKSSTQGETATQGQPQSQPSAVGAVQGQPVQGQVQSQPTAQVQGQPIAQPGAVQGQPQPVSEVPYGEPSVEGEPVSNIEIVPGATISFDGGRTGEVLATNPSTGIIVIKTADNQDVVEVHESRVTVIGDKILETEDSLKKYMSNLITEVKKRKASENTEPEFISFLTEKNKRAWYDLAKDDKEKVIFSINESGNNIYSENQLLSSIQEALTVKKSFEDTLIDNMPSSLKPIWENVNSEYKKSILSAAKLYPNLNTPVKMERFWESRNLESYNNINESKKVINESKYVDSTSLEQNYIDSFIAKIKNLS